MNRAGYPIDLPNINKMVLEKISEFTPDIVWFDKVLTIKPKTLLAIKEMWPQVIIAGYSPDDMAQRHNQSRYYLDGLKYYDYYFTTKTYNVPELKVMGARNPIFVGNAYDPEIHQPMELTQFEKSALGGSVGFIGAWEADRAAYILALAEAGVKVRWWGWQGKKSWENRNENLIMENKPLWGVEYAKAINAFDINLCFLRKINRDRQTTRSIEIPACGGFMLAERTDEHLSLFEEGVEAEFFSSKDELIDKVQYYLEHPEKRLLIAQAGRLRCLNSGYSNDARIKSVVDLVCRNA
jgi:spore maturation protein CgeB